MHQNIKRILCTIHLTFDYVLIWLQIFILNYPSIPLADQLWCTFANEHRCEPCSLDLSTLPAPVILTSTQSRGSESCQVLINSAVLVYTKITDKAKDSSPLLSWKSDCNLTHFVTFHTLLLSILWTGCLCWHLLRRNEAGNVILLSGI